jgi:hypothetical protein
MTQKEQREKTHCVKTVFAASEVASLFVALISHSTSLAVHCVCLSTLIFLSAVEALVRAKDYQCNYSPNLI